MQALKTLVAGMGVMIILLMVALGWGLYRKSEDPDFKLFAGSSAPPPDAPATPLDAPGSRFGNIVLPGTSGCRIGDLRIDNGRLIVWTSGEADCNQVFILSAETGDVLGTVATGR